jgi:hypothetical protein
MAHWFDNLTRKLATPVSRRRAFGVIGAGIAGAVLFPGEQALAANVCSPPCGPNQICSGNTCVCVPHTVSCDGGKTCINLSYNTANCGACGHACPSGQICRGGACDSCAAGSAPCGAAGIPLSFGAQVCCGTGGKSHCANDGAGNFVCCRSGLSACPSGGLDTCVNWANDPSNCGGCGGTTNPQYNCLTQKYDICQQGTCQCSSGRVYCDAGNGTGPACNAFNTTCGGKCCNCSTPGGCNEPNCSSVPPGTPCCSCA